MFTRSLLLAVTLVCGPPCLPAEAAAPRPEVVTLRLPGADGTVTPVSGLLSPPAESTAASAPWPVVVMLHDGLGMDARLSLLAERFQVEGWATLELDLVPASEDGVAPPGPDPLGPYADGRALAGSLAEVLSLLVTDHRIDPEQVAALGFGLGGRAALLAGSEEVASLSLGAYGVRFAAHAALYPGCDALLAEDFAEPVPWSAAPVAILNAAEDGRDPAGACATLRQALVHAGRAPALWQDYAGTTYGWDLGATSGEASLRLPRADGPPLAVRSDPWIASDATARVVHFLGTALRRAPGLPAGSQEALR
ncbi:dienelactone hydrolase family protein [Roseomonas sp. BN140053]|uniref:dienelactone hydrolase family protein n=1 Tax=Roseomonas sp. BN140053 TaxID=3391898 RepID=UPI0039E7A79E